MKIYRFIGAPCWDLIIYLSVLLKDANQKVLVVDHSEEQEVMNCIEKPMDLDGVIHSNQVDFVGGGIRSFENLEEYDVVLWLCPTGSNEISVTEIEGIIMVTDNRRRNMEFIMEHLKTMNGTGPPMLIQEGSTDIIIRDIVDKKYGKNYYQMDQKAKGMAIHELYFDEIDYSSRVQLEHYVIGRLTALSKDMESVLIHLAVQISQLSVKLIREVYKNSLRRRKS